jgi:hypothetical protein
VLRSQATTIVHWPLGKTTIPDYPVSLPQISPVALAPTPAFLHKVAKIDMVELENPAQHWNNFFIFLIFHFT